MKYIKAFISGMIFPSILIPFALWAALLLGRPQAALMPFIHFVPLIWGLWNVFYFAFLQKTLPFGRSIRHLITGAILGLIMAIIAMFGFNLSAVMHLSKEFAYSSLIIVPVIYALFWVFIVKPLNDLVGLTEVS